MTKVRPLLLFILLLSYAHATSQTLTGKVIDASTKQPLPHAHIAIPGTGEGTITDENGNFKLILRDYQKAKNIVASYVGYRTERKTLNAIDHALLFALHPDTTELKSVEVMVPNPLMLLREATKRIPSNHGGDRLLTAFYRKSTRDKNKHIQVSESFFKWNLSPGQYHQVKVIKAREAEDAMAFNGVGMGIGTHVSAIKGLDFTFDPQRSFLKEENLKKHVFFYEGLAMREGVTVHEISFDQKKIKEALYKGRIFLDTTSLAFVAAEYELSPAGIKYFHIGNAAERAAMKLLDIHINVNVQNTSITYRQFGNRWYPNHMVTTENVLVRSKRFNFNVPATLRTDFLVTDIDTLFSKPFPEEELVHKGFIESVTDTMKTFWEDYNIIPTQVNYDAIAKEIEGRNGYTKIKTTLKDTLRKFPKDKGARVDSILTYYYREGMFNGTALVKYRGKTIVHKGYGLANREQNIKNDTSTIFRIGSIAKTFTSRIIWQLKQEGLLRYEDSVQRFVPWYPYHGITIHHLLTHSSGIPNYMDQANFLDSIQHPFTAEQLISHFGMQAPTFLPGSDFRYSNTGYTLLALIAEKASGKKFNELFIEKITTPLQLTGTTFGQTNNAAKAIGYMGEGVEPYYATENAVGGGGISSTASDLLRWSDAHHDEKFNELFTPRTWYHDWGAYYGYGWNIDKYQFWLSKKHIIQYHGGTDLGFKSMLARQPDKDNVVILLNNTGEFPLFDITDLILRELN